MSKKYEKLTKEQKALNGLANFIIMHGNNDDYIEWHDTIRQALIELEELKRDVKRYFYLANEEEITKEVMDEFSKILDKLSKVGKEE